MIDLETITDPSFVKNLTIKELKELAEQIRKFLIENISITGGHLSSNLGIVEITIAMYYVFDPDKDSFLFDVGHQSYVHKILTGRAKDFKTLRQYGGMSGYINRNESVYDVWESGHSSTTISAMSGMILSRKDDSKIISVIGDSSIMNGVALEGLNFLGQVKNVTPIVILNDNKMGISKTVGAMANALLKLRGTAFFRGTKKVLTKIFPAPITRFCHQVKKGLKGFILRDNIFEDLGFDYYGPYDGNDIGSCIRVMKRIKKAKEPVVLHLLTKKGKGYKPSEEDKTGSFHGVPPFDIETGKPKSVPSGISYSKLVADYLVKKRETKDFMVVTPAMKSGAKLFEFANKYPDDFYDVGIAEEHAAVMSAGAAICNKKVCLLMYSTFAQRAYDEILNDIARQNLNVIIGIDRAGIVGEDGVTHQGIYDVAMFMAMPNIIVTMPRNSKDVVGLFNYAMDSNKPMVIRYPRANALNEFEDINYKCDLSWEKLTDGRKAVVLSYGPDVERISEICKNLDVMVIDAKCIKPIDEKTLKEVFGVNKPIIVIEQVVASGTLYHKVLEFKEENSYKAKVIKHSFDSDTLISHGSMNDVYSHYGFSDDKLIDLINGVIKND